MVHNLFLVRGACADVVLPKTALSRQFLTQALRNVTDPGWARGAPQPATILSLTITGALIGCRSLTVIAIWQHVAD